MSAPRQEAPPPAPPHRDERGERCTERRGDGRVVQLGVHIGDLRIGGRSGSSSDKSHTCNPQHPLAPTCCAAASTSAPDLSETQRNACPYVTEGVHVKCGPVSTGKSGIECVSQKPPAPLPARTPFVCPDVPEVALRARSAASAASASGEENVAGTSCGGEGGGGQYPAGTRRSGPGTAHVVPHRDAELRPPAMYGRKRRWVGMIPGSRRAHVHVDDLLKRAA